MESDTNLRDSNKALLLRFEADSLGKKSFSELCSRHHLNLTSDELLFLKWGFLFYRDPFWDHFTSVPLKRLEGSLKKGKPQIAGKQKGF